MLHGILIGPSAWYKEWFESMKKAGEGGVVTHTVMWNTFAASGQINDKGALIDHKDEYLHIKDGVLVTGDNRTNAMPWRVKLTSVAAWSLGSSPPSSDEAHRD